MYSVQSAEQEDQTIRDCLDRLSDARKYLITNDLESCMDKTDTALERLLNFLCRKSGASSSSEIADKSGKTIPFSRWGVTQYITHLEKVGEVSKAEKAAFFKVHNLRNEIKHHNATALPKLLERAIVVVEYAARSEDYKPSLASKEGQPEGGSFVLPKTRTKVVPRSQMKNWAPHGWYESRSYGPNIEIRRKPYSKWEVFEMKLRFLLLRLGFQDCIADIENFSYTDLGPQVDACAGSDGFFFVMDCTSKHKLGQKSIQYKIDDCLKKQKGIMQRVDKLFPGRYPNKVFVVCTEDIEVTDSDKQKARDAGIRLVDNDEVNSWFRYYTTLGTGLRYHIVKGLSGFSPVIVDNEKDPFFHYRAFRLDQDGQIVYHLLGDPERLLKLAYVYRLELGDPQGYQRPLIRKKILNISGFLATPGNFFANNLVLCFDSLVNNEYWPDFDSIDSEGSSMFGTLHIPKMFCSAEVIDGQHRLYGYFDATDKQSNRAILEKRRIADRLSIVAITDPTNNQRATLFVDINSNQTKVNPRQVYALVGRVRPNTLMGYTANVVMALNAGPVFRNKIHIPGVNKSSGKTLNIANLGNGLQGRKLLNKEEPWNLFGGDRAAPDYALGDISLPVKQIQAFFKPFSRDKTVAKFVFTNNGANVVIRILAEMMRFEYARKKPLSKAERTQVISTTKNALAEKQLKELQRRSDSEAGRADLAKELMAVIQTNKGMANFAAGLFN